MRSYGVMQNGVIQKGRCPELLNQTGDAREDKVMQKQIRGSGTTGE